ncbi:putative F-box domain, galactose oxidase/kelch, beta-propeller, F-box associated interaction [Helianthus annuus]|nr:putative F-box domain, galactose oxidase/kelch, beta-propeller, F-box associated interaction [Helianthus annuus]
MSDHIPFEIQSEIMNMFPVISLLRFRSVCKAWRSLIESSDFITHYRSQQQHLLVSYHDRYEQKNVLIVDDTFPQQKVSLSFPVSVKEMLKYDPRIISSCHGLVCFYCDSARKAVIWNISVRKSVAVFVPNSVIYETTLGFGVCRKTRDPKIVKIRYIGWWRSLDINSSYIPSQVEVFTLSTGAWRSPFGRNLPRTSAHYYHNDEVVIDGVFYWLATDSNTMLIVSFDMTSEEFREITLPDDLSQTHCNRISMSYLGNSLVVCGYDKHAINRDLCVWMMGGDVSNSFTKLFTIPSYGDAILRGFWKSGDPIIDNPGEHLAVYEPYSKRIHYHGIDGVESSFKVYPYTETLFLLGQPDNMVYNGI